LGACAEQLHSTMAELELGLVKDGGHQNEFLFGFTLGPTWAIFTSISLLTADFFPHPHS